MAPPLSVVPAPPRKAVCHVASHPRVHCPSSRRYPIKNTVLRVSERVFETGHVYRAEPHAMSRHLTRVLSRPRDGVSSIGAEDVIELERQLLTFHLRAIERGARRYARSIPEVAAPFNGRCARVGVWRVPRSTGACGSCRWTSIPRPSARSVAWPRSEHGIAAVFVLGFPLSARLFYTHPRAGTRQRNRRGCRIRPAARRPRDYDWRPTSAPTA